MQFRTKDGCDVTLHETPEGDVLISMHVGRDEKGLATATVASAPDGSKVILGTYASLKLDPESRAALRAALNVEPEQDGFHGTPVYDEAHHFAYLRWPVDKEMGHDHRESNRRARSNFLRGVAFALAKVGSRIARERAVEYGVRAMAPTGYEVYPMGEEAARAAVARKPEEYALAYRTKEIAPGPWLMAPTEEARS